MLSTSRLTLGATTILLAAALSACGGPAATPSPSAPATTATPETSATPTPTPTPTPVPVSNSIDAITVSGAAGAAPEVKIPTPFAVDQTRTRTLTPGSGPEASATSIVEVNYVGVNARTGQTFDSSFERGQPTMFSLEQVVPGFTKGLTGRKPGERVLIAMPGVDGYDSSGGNQQAGIEVGDTLVFVVDVIAVSLSGPQGQTTGASVPVTVGDDAGKPTVTVPAGTTPPAQLVATPLIKGVQRGVGPQDFVLVHYRAWSWKTGKLIEDKFDAPDSGAIAETIPAWRNGIVGQPIGSRVLLVAPPSEAYPNGSQNPPVEAGDTVVYVVDILFSSAVR